MSANHKTAVFPETIETYIAQGSVKQGGAAAMAAAVSSAYKIEVRFLGGLTQTQKNAFKAAADRWSRIITGDLPTVMVDGEAIDDLLIEAKGSAIDGAGQVLGQAGPTHLRPESAGVHALLPAKGEMTFDTADLAEMEARGTLVDVITHEMGHVIGIGTIWELKDLLVDGGTFNPTFSGALAQAEYGALKGTGPAPVPVENTGGQGTADGHWRESVFKTELMSGFIDQPGNPISRLTVAALQDMGYEVDMSAAEPYQLPNLMALAEAGVAAALAEEEHLHTIPTFAPQVLPAESLI